MKKGILFVCALALSAATFASINPKLERPATETAVAPATRVIQTRSDISFEEQGLQGAFKARAYVDSIRVPYYVPNSYNSGTPSKGVGYVNLAQIVVPFMDTVSFYNYYNLKSTWYLNDQEIATDTNRIDFGVTFGEYPLPLMKTASIKYSENPDSIYAFYDYSYGALYTSYYADYGFYTSLSVAPAFITPLTKCAMYTEVPYSSSGRETYGSDWTFVGAPASIGTYSYGTKMKDPKAETEEYFDTIFVPYSNNSTIYIDHISLGVYTDGDEGIKSIFPGEDDHVRLTIYPFSAEGIDWANPIARAIADSSSYVGASSSSSWYGILNFNFTEEDPITGAEMEVPAIVSGNFIIALDEFNNGTANFGIISDYYTEIEGETWLKSPSRITQLWSTPSNILLNLFAILPEFQVAEEIEFNAGETQKVITVPSNVWFDDILIDADSWITAEVETDYETTVEEGQTYYDHKFINTLTINVETSSEAREGTIEIDALGLPVTIKISQEATAGVENVYLKNDNKFYNVLGIEVGEDYKGVVIRNGEKFVR